MKRFSYVLTNSAALQGRSVQMLSREASRFSSRISLSDGEKDVPASEPQSVVGMDIGCGSRVTVTVEGKDEEAAVAAMQNYFVANM